VIRVGNLSRPEATAPPGALVDEHGLVSPEGLGWVLDWRIGADDRWRMPQRETAVRQSLVDEMPVACTAMRVPGGDAVSHAYGLPDAGGLVVIEITNASPAPFVIALVVRGARSVALVDTTVVIDRRAGLLLPRVPSRWSVTRGGSTDVEVCGGSAREGPFPATRDRAGRVEAAFLLPVPHRASVRAAVAAGAESSPVDLRGLPGPDDAVRGWQAQLARGMRIDVPDPRATRAITAARAQVVLAAQASRCSGATLTALEDWGFDDEFEAAWRHAGGRARRAARSRPARPPRADELDMLLAHAHAPGPLAAVAAELLVCMRGLVVWEAPDGLLVLLAELPPEWRGRPIEVHGAPTRAGRLSYAVRWHGDRPALLWSAPPGVRLCAPGLDADWSSDEQRGEALLASVAA
jgi:hypothetical protein